MVILHVAHVDNDPCNGVSIVVPSHVIHQQKYADVALLNCNNCSVKGVNHLFYYIKGFKLSELQKPFNQPDLVVFHEVYRPAFVDLSFHLRRLNIPYIILPHASLTQGAQRIKWFKKLTGNLLLFNAYIHGAKAIHFLSQNELKESHVKNVKIVIPNGISMPLKHKSGYSASGMKMLYIGRLNTFPKGIDILIESITKISEYMRNHEIKLFLYGPFGKISGSHTRQLIDEAQISDIVTLNKEIVGSAKEIALLDADVFIQTSRFEGIPTGLLEAMSYGLPCIVTEGTNLAGVISSNEIGVGTDQNPENIATAIKWMYKHKSQFPQFSSNAIQLIKLEYDWDKIAQETIAKYKSLIGE